ncbi:hypothetical protein Tco_1390503 [Tanacetum coccineum]
MAFHVARIGIVASGGVLRLPPLDEHVRPFVPSSSEDEEWYSWMTGAGVTYDPTGVKIQDSLQGGQAVDFVDLDTDSYTSG